jgi:hypothetical protein
MEKCNIKSKTNYRQALEKNIHVLMQKNKQTNKLMMTKMMMVTMMNIIITIIIIILIIISLTQIEVIRFPLPILIPSAAPHLSINIHRRYIASVPTRSLGNKFRRKSLI